MSVDRIVGIWTYAEQDPLSQDAPFLSFPLFSVIVSVKKPVDRERRNRRGDAGVVVGEGWEVDSIRRYFHVW